LPFLPLSDGTPRVRIGLTYVTYGLLAACVIMFLYQLSVRHPIDMRLVYGLGSIPAVLLGEAQLPPGLEMLDPWMTLISYQFLHGGWDHIIGNLLFLWVFADNVEDVMGHGRFLVFYLLCGVLAGLAHVAADASSQAPLIGASGAISGVLGAYLVLHPFARLMVLIVFVPIVLPAWLLLIVWFGFQAISAWGDSTGPVAWWAHIGGFVAGAALIYFFKRPEVPLFAREAPRRITLIPPSGRKPSDPPWQSPGPEQPAPDNWHDPAPDPEPNPEPRPNPWAGSRDEDPPARNPGPWGRKD